ncbi:cytochrome P450 3A13-like isoform X1 [Apostichopus japonicus]|uniref:cytochrome P450 3A13-like isoform X1 n=2 Tax=Stichopus japonicus TaxID=307972 RepID=UPI003AB89238
MAVYELLTNSTTLALVGSLVAIYIATDFWKKLYFVRNGIPGPIPLPVIGTLFSFLKGQTSDMIAKREKYGKVYGLSLGKNLFCIHDLDMLQEIMISKFSSFPNHAEAPFKDRPLDAAVSNARDAHWKAVRSTLSPAFTASKLKQINNLINECCDRLLKNFEEQQGKEGGIQCKDLFGSYSMEVVASVFFGIQVDSQGNPDDPFVKHAKDAFSFSIYNLKLILVLLVPGVGKLYDLFDVSITNPKIKKFFLGVIAKALELRDKGEVKRMDILQLMADSHRVESTENEEAEDSLIDQGAVASLSEKKVALSTDEIMANAFIFFLAGYETTNSALCFTAYLLATNPEKQDQLFEEVKMFAPSREELTYEVLSQMEYLDCFVRESLRLYPPAAGLERYNDKGDIIIKDLLIPEGFQVYVPVYAIHHDPEIWDNPEEFRPERFNKENRSKIHPVSWLPFGDGPRACLGVRLAMMEIKFAVVRLLQEFKIETCPETEIPPVLNKATAFICPPNGVKVQVVSRENDNGKRAEEAKT